MSRRVLRLGFVSDEPPRSVIITPAADILLGDAVCGGGHHMNGGPITLDHRVPGREYPATLATISEPWMQVDYDTYLAMVEQ